MKFVIEFEPGDEVVVLDKAFDMNGNPIPPGSAEVADIDLSDPTWYYRIRCHDKSNHWVKRNALDCPESVLRTPPTFASIEEANAWLEANS